ncbi:phage tail protein [Erwinia sp. S43]|uniref:phage tail protein n=1 Tax=Erwinia sp. S43 TaxID=2769339 RepID=UPI0019091291|nr:phage tail protein [Erwinia sp. S43]
MLTKAGEAMLAAAAVTGIPVSFTQMAIGDGVSESPTPDSYGLISERYRGQLNRLVIADQAENVIRAEMMIPAQVGGFWIREAALFDDAGVCLAVANTPESYKPLLTEGAGRLQTVNIWIAVSNTASVQLTTDPSVILATASEVRKAKNDAMDYADEAVTELNTTIREAIRGAVETAIEKARRDFWEEENPRGTVRFFAQKVDPNELYPWSTWVYTGENKSIRVGKADGTNVGQTGGSDTVTIGRENLPAEKIDVSGQAESAELNNVETTEAGAAEFNVYRFGADGRENSKGRFSLDDVEMGDIPVAVKISAHKHKISLTVPERSVSGQTEALGQGKTISVVEAHTLLMCWARTA